MMLSVLNAENVKKFGELELTEDDPTKLTELCERISQETATYVPWVHACGYRTGIVPGLSEFATQIILGTKF